MGALILQNKCAQTVGLEYPCSTVFYHNYPSVAGIRFSIIGVSARGEKASSRLQYKLYHTPICLSTSEFNIFFKKSRYNIDKREKR